MGKAKIGRGGGFGIVGWLFLMVVLYAILSVSIGMSTNDRTCRFGYEREWQFFPPHWVCHR
jgi:hypothetical protein